MADQPWHMRGPLLAEAVLSVETCEALLEHFHTSVVRPRSYQGLVDESLRKCDFAEIPQVLEELVENQTRPYVDKFFEVDTVPVPGQRQVVYRYPQGIGFVAHHDEVTDIEFKRSANNGQPVIGGDLTAVFLLNRPDEYNGGALFFESPYLEFRPPRGTLVAFPATRDFMHGVSPIRSGERFTLLTRRSVLRHDSDNHGDAA